MTTVYIALGTNVGDRERNLRERSGLLVEAGIRILKISSIYETEPVDYLEQGLVSQRRTRSANRFARRDLLQSLRAIESP